MLVIFFIRVEGLKKSSDSGWGLVRQASLLVGVRVEGVGAVVKHLLCIVVGPGSSLNAKIPEHGVGFPTS